VTNFVIGLIVLTDITLASYVEALVRLELGIVPVALFSHSLPLQSSPKWFHLKYTIGVGAIILSFHSRVDGKKASRYFSDRVSCAVMLCL